MSWSYDNDPNYQKYWSNSLNRYCYRRKKNVNVDCQAEKNKQAKQTNNSCQEIQKKGLMNKQIGQNQKKEKSNQEIKIIKQNKESQKCEETKINSQTKIQEIKTIQQNIMNQNKYDLTSQNKKYQTYEDDKSTNNFGIRYANNEQKKQLQSLLNQNISSKSSKQNQDDTQVFKIEDNQQNDKANFDQENLSINQLNQQNNFHKDKLDVQLTLNKQSSPSLKSPSKSAILSSQKNYGDENQHAIQPTNQNIEDKNEKSKFQKHSNNPSVTSQIYSEFSAFDNIPLDIKKSLYEKTLIKELKKQIQSLKNQKEQKQLKLAQKSFLKQRKNQAEQQNKLKEQLAKKNQEYKVLQQKNEWIQKRYNTNELQKNQLLVKNSLLESELNNCKQKIAQLKTQKDNQITGLKRQIEIKTHQVKQLNIKLNQIQTKKIDSLEELLKKQKQINSLTKQHQDKIDLTMRQINELKRQLSQQKKTIVQKQNKIQNLQNNLSICQQSIKDQKIEIAQFKKVNLKLKDQNNQKIQQIKTFQKTTEKLKLDIQKLEQTQTNLKNKLQNKQKQNNQLNQSWRKNYNQVANKKKQLQDSITQKVNQDIQQTKKISQNFSIFMKKQTENQNILKNEKKELLLANKALIERQKKTFSQKMNLKWKVQDLSEEIVKNEEKYLAFSQKSKAIIKNLQKSLEQKKNQLQNIQILLNNIYQKMSKYYPQSKQFDAELNKNKNKLQHLITYIPKIVQKILHQNKSFYQNIVYSENLTKKAVECYNKSITYGKKLQKAPIYPQQDKLNSQDCRRNWESVKYLIMDATTKIIDKQYKIQKVQKQKTDLNKIIDDLLIQIQTSKTNISQLNQKIKKLQLDSKNQTDLLNKSNMAAAKQRMRFDETKAKLQQSISQLQYKIEKLEQQVKDYIQLIQKMNKISKTQNQKITMYQKKIKDLEDQLNRKNEQIRLLQNQVATLKTNINRIQAELRQTKNKLDSQVRKNTDLNSKNINLNDQILNKTSSLQLKLKQIQSLQISRNNLQLQVLNQKNECEKLKSKILKFQKQAKQLIQLNGLSQLKNKKSLQKIDELNIESDTLRNNIKTIGQAVQKRLQSQFSLASFDQIVNFIHSFTIKIPKVLIVSNILLDLSKQRQWLVNEILKFQEKKQIVSSNLLFNSEISVNAKFTKSLKQQANKSSFIILYRSSNNVIFGSYSHEMGKQTFLFGLKENNKNILYLNNKKQVKIPGIKFENEMFLVYGASQMKLKSNNLGQIIISTPCGSKYFNNVDWLQLTGSNGTTVAIKEMQMHQITFSE